MAVIFTTNMGSLEDDVLGIRAHYEVTTDTLTIDNAVIGRAGHDSLGSVLLPVTAGDHRYRFVITLEGGAGNDTLTGQNATDRLFGGAGDDTLASASGSLLSGGIGLDTLSLDAQNLTRNLVVSYLAQAAGEVTLADRSTISGFEKFLVQGGSGNDTLDLSGAAHARDSNLNGFAGNDTVRVDAGTQGSITFNAGDGTDRIVADLSALTGSVQLNANTAMGGAVSAAGLVVGSNDVERFEVTSGSGDDDLGGGSFNDLLVAGSGADRMYDGAGRDTLEAGSGNDTVLAAADGVADAYRGGLGTDLLDLSLATRGAVAHLGAGVLREGGFGLGRAEGFEAVLGSQFGDHLIGSDGNDSLAGHLGADRLVGGAGRDRLEGGGDADTFVLVTPGEGVDLLLDFATGEDRIEISRAGFGLAEDYALRFQIRSQATGEGPVFLFRAGAQQLVFDSNGGEAGGVTVLADLLAAPLAAGDLVLA